MTFKLTRSSLQADSGGRVRPKGWPGSARTRAFAALQTPVPVRFLCFETASRTVIATAILAAASAAVSGCQQSESSEYQEYAEVVQSGDEALFDDQAADSDPSTVRQTSKPEAEDGPAAPDDEAASAGNGDPSHDPPDGNGNSSPEAETGNSPSPDGDAPDNDDAPYNGEAVEDPPGVEVDSGIDAPPGGNSAINTPPAADEPRAVKVLVKDRKFVAEGPESALRVSYDDIDLLKVLNMEPVTPDAPKLMPKWLKELDGKRIRIRGFMYPPFQETGLTGFALARDNQICCFGRDPKIYDVFAVRLKENVTTDYIQNRPFDVVGVFHIDPIEEDGSLFQLYRIDDAIVIDD